MWWSSVTYNLRIDFVRFFIWIARVLNLRRMNTRKSALVVIFLYRTNICIYTYIYILHTIHSVVSLNIAAPSNSMRQSGCPLYSFRYWLCGKNVAIILPDLYETHFFHPSSHEQKSPVRAYFLGENCVLVLKMIFQCYHYVDMIRSELCSLHSTKEHGRPKLLDMVT